VTDLVPFTSEITFAYDYYEFVWFPLDTPLRTLIIRVSTRKRDKE
jgi:hypothetical protein